MGPGSCPVERILAPRAVLQDVVPWLSVADIRLARLVCKEWAGELATAVHSVRLPAGVWQTCIQAQQRQLDYLQGTYQSCRHVNLAADSQQAVDEQTLLLAVTALKQLRSLNCITVTNLGPYISCWTVTVQGLGLLSSRLRSLCLSDVKLPGPQGLDALEQLTNIKQLVISSSYRNKLQQQHVAAIASMQQLQQLSLSFRVVNGTLLEPLALDCLAQLSNLRELEVMYTGMSELSTGVCFAAEELLSGCTALSSLVLSRVPVFSFRGLRKLLQLQQLSVTQLACFTDDQVRSLGLCTQLQQLRVEPVPVELVPHLARLTGLTTLQVSIWAPRAGGPVLPANGILALGALRNLQSLELSGPVAIHQEDVQQLSVCWKWLKSLDLHVSLPQGTRGFAGFRQLEVLRLKPWTRRCTLSMGEALAGLDEGVLHNNQGTEVCEHDLPLGLTELSGQDLVFSCPRRDHLMYEGLASLLPQYPARGPGSARCLRVLKLKYSPDTLELTPPLVLPGPDLLRGLHHFEIQHPHVTSHHMAAVIADCSRSLTHLSINTADVMSQLSKPLVATAFYSTAVGSTVSVSNSPALCGRAKHAKSGNDSRHKGVDIGSLYSTAAAAAGAAAAAVVAAGPVATAVGLPATGITVASLAATAAVATAGATASAFSSSSSLSAHGNASAEQPCGSGSSSNTGCPGLAQGLRSLYQKITAPSLPSTGAAYVASFFNDVCFFNGGFGTTGGPSNSCAGLSCMGQGLCGGQALTLLGQCTALQEVNLVIGDRVLGPKVRTAIASLPQLQKLSIAVASDRPSTAAKGLGELFVCMKCTQRLQKVGIGMEGPGAREVLQSLLERVSAGLPACQVSMLKAPLL